MSDQPDHRGADSLVQRPPPTEWGEGYASLPEHWRKRIGRLASLAFYAHRAELGMTRVATRWMFDLGLALRDARASMPAAGFARWVGTIEVDPGTIDTAETLVREEPRLEQVERREPPAPHELRLTGAKAEQTWAEAQERCRETFVRACRFGSAVNELRAEIGEAAMGLVLEALKVGATPVVLEESLGFARDYGDARGVVSEDVIARVIGRTPID